MEIDYVEMKLDLIRKLNRYLEDACSHKTVRDRILFDISLGQADAIIDILEKYFDFREPNYSVHLQNMVEIVMYEEW